MLIFLAFDREKNIKKAIYAAFHISQLSNLVDCISLNLQKSTAAVNKLISFGVRNYYFFLQNVSASQFSWIRDN